MKEGKTEFTGVTKKIPDKKMDVFYNPLMEINRDITIAILKYWSRKKLRIALPLAGTGIRGLRIINELPKNKILSVSCNDHDKEAYNYLKKNKLIINDERFNIQNDDANKFMINSKAYDYIDLDPYGSPNQFLDSSIQRLSIKGILGITATDTAALAGPYTNACKRKYFAIPKKADHEIGLRILIRKVQLIGMQYDKALIPILSYHKDHYYRVFFLAKKSKTECNKLYNLHKNRDDFGPMYSGPLHDKTVLQALKSLSQNKFLQYLIEEVNSGLTAYNHFDIHGLGKKNKIHNLKNLKEIINKTTACHSHIKNTAIWTDKSEKELLKIIQ